MSRRILIADALATNRIALKAALTAARYAVQAVPSGSAAIEAIDDQLPDLVICDAQLPDMTGEDFCAYLTRRFGAATPPLILLTDDASPAFRLGALAAGASALLDRALDRPWLLTNLRGLLRAHDSRAELRRRNVTAARLGFAENAQGFAAPARIAVISTRRGDSASMLRGLRELLHDPVEQMTPVQALGAADSDTAPEVFVLCHDDQPEDTLALLAELRARSATRRAAILVEYDPAQRDKGARALDQGASDIVEIDAGAPELVLRIVRQLRYKRDADALRRTVDAGLQLAAYDPLTGLYNRRYALHHLNDLASRPHADGRGYGVMIVDVDHFKAVNDQHGHPAGDRILQQVAAHLRENIRDVDLVARIGGEEFLVALPNTSPDEILAAADRLRAAIASRILALGDPGRTLTVTVSIGVATSAETRAAPDRVMLAADAALYAAKHAGRNRVRLAMVEPDSGIEPPEPARPVAALPARLETAHGLVSAPTFRYD